MRASIKNLTIAEGGNLPQIEWQNAPLYDAPINFPLTLTITRQNLAIGRTNIRACAIAQSCKEKNFAYFAIGVDMAHIGAFLESKPVRLRYRSGNLPRKFDAAVAKLQETGVFDVRHLETESYTLQPPSEHYSLEYKKSQNSPDKVTRRKSGAKRPYNRKPNVTEFTGRGRLHASG